MELDIRTYILLGGGLLIAVVLLHGFWLAKRSRRPIAVLEGTGAAGQGMEQMPLDVDSALLPEDAAIEEARSQPMQPMRRVEPTLGGVDVPADPTLASRRALAERREQQEERPEAADDSAPRRGRRIEIAGKRTEPTVPRNARRLEPRAAPRHHADPLMPEAEHAPAAGGAALEGDALQREPAAVEQEQEPAGGAADEVVILWVVARPQTALRGPTLVEAFSAAGLEYDGQVFQKLDAEGRELFAVANGVEPGTFDLSNIETFATRGVVFLLRLNAEGAAATFDAMLEAAQALAATAEAELKDEQHSNVSGQTVMHYRQRVADFKRASMRR